VKGIKLLAAAILVISPFAAQAVPISYTIDFTGLNGGGNVDGEVGPFSYEGLNWTNSGQCPDVPSIVGSPCAQFNEGDILTIYLTLGGEFDLSDFYWRSTGQQRNSDTALSWSGDDNNGSEMFGNLPGEQNGFGDTVQEDVGLVGLRSITFFNYSVAVTRVDHITLWFDDGLCNSSDCVSVPEPGTLALLGMGLLGMGLSRRRKKAL
jgi:hypothetical protein